MSEDTSSDVEDEDLDEDSGDDEPPEIDMNTFVLSLSTNAAMHLGMPLKGGHTEPVDLTLAKQSIDMLALLEDKTKGNLTGDEERFLAQMLTELRLKYATIVEEQKAG